MKKIITSLGMIVFAAAIVVGGTGAFFSDTETSTANVFTAGAIDLLVDNSSYGFDWNRPGAVNPTGVWGPNANNSWTLRNLDECGTTENPVPCVFFNFTDLKPGDYGEDTISLHVQNDAWACMAFNLTATPENGVNDPEADVPDTTVGVNEGELQNYLEFVFWKDDGDNVLEVGEQVIQGLSGLAKDIFTGAKLAIADSSTIGGPLLANTLENPAYIGKGWCFGDLVVDPEVPAVNAGGPTPGNTGFTCDPTGNHNIAQTDGIGVDVTFEAIQARHNDNFLCTPRTPEPEVVVGAALTDYVAPVEGCDVTVDDNAEADFSSIQAAIDDVNTTNGETICVADGEYNENVNINKEITLLGDGAANTSVINAQGGSQSAAINITANNVTVRGFALNGHSNGTAVVYVNGSVNNVVVDSNLINVGSPDGLLTTGGVSNVTVSNNKFVGDGVNAQRLAYVNGLASVAVNSSNVDFFDNTFDGPLAGTMVMGHEGSGSEVRRNVFNLSPAYTVIEAWTDSVIITTNNFNGAGGIKVAQMENGNTGAQGTVDASGNWWGDPDPAGNTSGDVDTSDAQAVAYPQN